jgi:hypothetical protein
MKTQMMILVVAMTGFSAVAQEQGEGGGARRERFHAQAEVACGQDVATLCSDATGFRERGECLHQNAAKLSPTCSAFLSKHHPPHGPRPADEGDDAQASVGQ